MDGARALLDATTVGSAPLVRALDRDHPLETWTAGAGATRTYLASLPLTARGELYGRLLTARTRGGYGDHELATLHFAARLAAIHLGHARRLAATEKTALDLQRALVAEPGRPHPNLEIASRYLPAGARALVGGDWFETIRLHFGRTLSPSGT